MIRVVFVLACGATILMLALLILPPGREFLHDAKAYLSVQRHLRHIGGTLHHSGLMIPMPDGPRLATDVYLPKGRAGDLPTILVRLPYGKRRYPDVRHWVDLFLPKGFAVVVQDMRGRWGSEGIFSPYPNAAEDGVATLDWVVDQAWSNGRVGTIGCSALGESQIILGAARHPAHRAMIPIGAGGAIGEARGDFGFFGFFEGGIPALASAVGWFGRFGGKTSGKMSSPKIAPTTVLSTLPLRDTVARSRPDKTDFEEMLDNFGTPNGFAEWGYISDGDRFDAAVLMVDTWYDQAVQSTLALSGLMAESAPSVQTIIAPGTHCDTEGAINSGKLGDLSVSGSFTKPLNDIYLAFMSHHLGSGPKLMLPPFSTYVLNEDRWLETSNWPPDQSVASTWLLSDDKLLAPDQTNESLKSRSFNSDPSNPVPTLGGAVCCTGDPATRSGPLFQNPIEDRNDLLLFTSDPLTEQLRIAGPVTTQLYVSSDTPDTDLVLRLTDVDPQGRSVLIQEGGLRLRYRNGFLEPKLMKPSEVYSTRV